MRLREHLDKSGVEPGVAKAIAIVAGKSAELRKHFISQRGLSDTENVYGETQMELDKFADNFFLGAFKESGLFNEVASEEQPEIVRAGNGRLSVVIDPLDGSGCIKTNLAVGTIVGIFDGRGVLSKGSELSAAMYVVYGPLTSLVYSVGKGVHEFVLSDSNEFVLAKENISIGPEKIMGPGGKRFEYLPEHEKFVSALEEKGFKVRFSGSFCADFNQILHYGGVFTYPGSKPAPGGKLRLLFEANPMAFIAANAGGYASTGTQAILGIAPQKIDERVPLYIGSRDVVELAEKCFKGAPQ